MGMANIEAHLRFIDQRNRHQVAIRTTPGRALLHHAAFANARYAMSDTVGELHDLGRGQHASLGETLKAATPALQLFGLRFWASACLALYIAFWLELDEPYWAAISAAIVCQPELGASLRKGWYRMLGTLLGGVVSLVLIAAFPQDRVLLLLSFALWASAAAFASTVLRNFASYSAALAGYTVAVILGNLLGAVGAWTPMQAFFSLSAA